MDRKFPTHILAIANKRAEAVTDAEASVCIAALQADARVASVRAAGRDVSGRALVEIAATDTIGGDLVGTVTVGRAVNALSETASGHALRQTEAHRQHQEFLSRKAELGLSGIDPDWEQERKENTRLLYALGVTHGDLKRIATRLMRGIYIDEESLAKWRLYLDFVVKGRPRELDLGIYISGIRPF